jgi:uncharacterized integral membrane protein
MPFLIVLCLVLLAVTVFSLQNGQAVTVRFLYFEVQSSLAIVTAAAMAAGVVIAGLAALASRLWQWKKRGPTPVSELSGPGGRRG